MVAAERPPGPTKRLVQRALLVWLAVLAAAFANGALRELVLQRVIGGLPDLASIVILIGVLAFAAWWMVHRTRPRRPLRDWFLVGVLWAGLTVAFELLFFRYVAGVPWETLIAAHDPREGGFFGLVILATLLAPPAMARLSGRS
jgi:hypothetical protein